MAQAIEHTRLLVLSLLSARDMYGYEMIAELEHRFDKTFSMKEGTLYPVLRALENSGALKSYQQETPAGRVRKYYRLTKKGAALLSEETRLWREYEKAINSVVTPLAEPV